MLSSPALRKAVDLLQAGRHDDAELQAQHVLALRPEDGSALNVIGVVALQKRRYDGAVEAFRHALKSQFNNPFIHFNLAEAYRRSRAFGLAISRYERAIQLKPDFAEAYAHKGDALRAMGRLADAASAYRAALDRQPRLAGALNGFGLLLQANGAAEEAARHFESAIAADLVGESAAVASLFANAGRNRLQKGAAIEGFTALAEAVSRCPQNVESWRTLARCLHHTKVAPSTKAFRDILASLIARNDVDPRSCATAAVALLKQNPAIAEVLQCVRDAAEDGRDPDLSSSLLHALLSDSLFKALLIAVPIPDVEIELLLTEVSERWFWTRREENSPVIMRSGPISSSPWLNNAS